MGRNKTIIAHAPIARLIKSFTGLRVSAAATAQLSNHLQDHGTKIALDACDLADHAGRHTVMGSDVQMASKR